MERHPCEALWKGAGGMQAEREIVSALFAAEGCSLPGRSTQQNCCVIREYYVLISGTAREKRIILSDHSGREKEDLSLKLINPEP